MAKHQNILYLLILLVSDFLQQQASFKANLIQMCEINQTLTLPWAFFVVIIWALPFRVRLSAVAPSCVGELQQMPQSLTQLSAILALKPSVVNYLLYSMRETKTTFRIFYRSHSISSTIYTHTLVGVLVRSAFWV